MAGDCEEKLKPLTPIVNYVCTYIKGLNLLMHGILVFAEAVCYLNVSSEFSDTPVDLWVERDGLFGPTDVEELFNPQKDALTSGLILHADCSNW